MTPEAILDTQASPINPASPGAEAPRAIAKASTAALAAAAALAACGGGGGVSNNSGLETGVAGSAGTGTSTEPAGGSAGGSNGTGDTTAPVATTPITDAQAARFLQQAGFAAMSGDRAAVQSKGFAAWLDEQLAQPVLGGTRYQWMVDNGYAVEANINNFAGADSSIWRRLIASPDPLRQHMTLALSEILVVSMSGLPIKWRNLAIAHYADILEKHAFGNYRELLQEVTLSLAMGTYLNMQGNRKEDPATGRVPDENYAREVMQLFSIGLQQLNLDGTVKTSNGVALDTYTQADITQLARVFTGWTSTRTTDPIASDFAYVTRPMSNTGNQYQAGDKTVLGTVIPASASAAQALNLALDVLFQHANVGPHIGRQLIQRFTASNPSSAYVARVAAAFNNNGQGVRGDFKAVLRAVLLDTEARTPNASVSGGRLREPVQRLVQWARSFGVTSKQGRWPIGDTSDPATRLGQSPFRSPSVFNFFRPGYVPPGNELGANQVTAPEFQLVNESTVAGYLNYMQSVIANGMSSGDVAADYSAEMALAADANALLQHLNLLLAADALGAASLSSLIAAVNSMPAATETNRLNRVRAAILLVMAAPEYLVQR
jgi:uncharacterized protein (DUF1800 family)